MQDTLYKKLYSKNNLQLAWMRVKTGQNIFYKNYYRDLLSGYEIAQEHNLANLSERLKGGSYQPSDIIKFYVPKASGLHRPISFLHLDDLIVYQAFCNIIVEKFSEKRKEYERKYIFSNILNRTDETSIFLFKKWSIGYKAYNRQIKKYYEDGNSWVAHFDLAAYYDTIDHFVLKNQISKNSYKDFTGLLEKCLEKWSNQKDSKSLHHSIPQGPLSSAVLGEFYILPIDRALIKKSIKYVRYVDDIKIFGKTKDEVLKGVIILERECKERGLIPQAKKYELAKADSLQDALGKNPSLSSIEKKLLDDDDAKTADLFQNSLDSRTFDISKLRYILKMISKNRKILRMVLDNIGLHPELSDEFCEFLLNYIGNSKIAEIIFNIMLRKPTVYEYTEGKYWELLAQFNIVNPLKQEYMTIAIDRLQKNYNNYALKYGIYKYLCSSKNKLVLDWIKYEGSSLIQGFIVPYISKECINSEEYRNVIPNFTRRSSYEPSLMCLKALIESNISTENLFDSVIDQSGVISNTLGQTKRIDSIGQILRSRYYLDYSDKWKALLRRDYLHSNKLLFLSEKAFFVDKNAWVSYLDTFNDIIIRALITLLTVKEPSKKWPKIKSCDGINIDYGKLLDPKNELSQTYPTMIDGLRIFHERRSRTPTSHAFDKKTSKETRIISTKEQKGLYLKMKNSYLLLLDIIQKYL